MEKNRNYDKIGNIFSLVVFVLAIFILIGFTTANSALFWILAIFNLLCGPVCLILYLMEVRRGVFASDKE